MLVLKFEKSRKAQGDLRIAILQHCCIVLDSPWVFSFHKLMSITMSNKRAAGSPARKGGSPRVEPPATKSIQTKLADGRVIIHEKDFLDAILGESHCYDLHEIADDIQAAMDEMVLGHNPELPIDIHFLNIYSGLKNLRDNLLNFRFRFVDAN